MLNQAETRFVRPAQGEQPQTSPEGAPEGSSSEQAPESSAPASDAPAAQEPKKSPNSNRRSWLGVLRKSSGSGTPTEEAAAAGKETGPAEDTPTEHKKKKRATFFGGMSSPKDETPASADGPVAPPKSGSDIVAEAGSGESRI